MSRRGEPSREARSGRPVAGGGREVAVAPERLARWAAGFAERHGPAGWARDPDGRTVTGRAADGAVAVAAVPFPPLPGPAGAPGETDPVVALARHAARERRVGVLLVRRGGHAAGVVAGERLVASKTGSRHVQGRTAAGGQSQQRYARRREGQAREAVAAAAEAAARVLLPAATDLEALVLGGDRRMVAAVLDDARLAPLRPLVAGPWLDVPDPRLTVLQGTVPAVRAVRVRLLDPAFGQDAEPLPLLEEDP